MKKIELKKLIKKILREQQVYPGPVGQTTGLPVSTPSIGPVGQTTGLPVSTPSTSPVSGKPSISQASGCTSQVQQVCQTFDTLLIQLKGKGIPPSFKKPTLWDRIRHAFNHGCGMCDFPHGDGGPWDDYDV